MESLFPCQEIGSFSKPSWLVTAPRRGKATKAEVEHAQAWGQLLRVEKHADLVRTLREDDLRGRKSEMRDWASLYVLRLLESVGLDYVYDGEQRRVEMYEYPIRRTRGFKFLGHVRSFDNKYFRKAACVDKAGFKEAYHLGEFSFVKEKARKEVKVPITGPYTLADWSFNEYYQHRRSHISNLRERRLAARRDLVMDLAREVLRPNITALVNAGAEVVQFDEPAATTHPEEVEIFVEGFNAATEGIDCKFTVHICYSDYSLLYPQVLEMKRCSQFDWEFANRDDEHDDGYAALALFREYDDGREVGLGVIDVHANEVETPELVKQRIVTAADTLDDPGRIYVNPDCGLRTRTWQVAYEKLTNMVRGAQLARDELSGP